MVRQLKKRQCEPLVPGLEPKKQVGQGLLVWPVVELVEQPLKEPVAEHLLFRQASLRMERV